MVRSSAPSELPLPCMETLTIEQTEGRVLKRSGNGAPTGEFRCCLTDPSWNRIVFRVIQEGPNDRDTDVTLRRRKPRLLCAESR